MSLIPIGNRLFHQVNIAVGFSRPGIADGSVHGHGIEQPVEESFEQGAWWKNKAVEAGIVEAGEGACRCGTCGACGARQYLLQARSLIGQTAQNTGEKAPRVIGKISDDKKGIAPVNKEKEQDKDKSEKPDSTEEQQNIMAVANELTLQEKLLLTRLQMIDGVVRAHETAHRTAGAGLIRGGVTYQYRLGPDGKRYAVGGEVSIDTSTGGNPEGTIRKMEAVRAAALAPAVPSAQDRRVAAQATLAILEARLRLKAEAEQVPGGDSLRGVSTAEDEAQSVA
ncbi:MAG: hypothetical protein KJ950_11795 [Proteobacteria bacterium]|nr:hypothetical protein [Pseudomonadota bacterium]MBU1688024.1 hypothetical protein [Pseudomonadota bacterium]